jgi:hypothetical protein
MLRLEIAAGAAVSAAADAAVSMAADGARIVAGVW